MLLKWMAHNVIAQLVSLDPSKGRRVVLGLDTNGIAPTSAVPGLTKINEVGPNVSKALREGGYSVEKIHMILGGNGHHFLYDVFSSK